MSFSPKSLFLQLLNCISFLTRIPVPRLNETGVFSLKDCIWCFSLVGLLIGGAGSLVLLIAQFAGLNLLLAVILVTAVTCVITGALHEDGFADFCDGLGVHDKDKAIAAMRDSRIGAFGVIGLVFVLGWRIAALAQLNEPGLMVMALLASHAGGRGLIAPLFLLPFAGQTGLAYAAGPAGRHSVIFGLAMTSILLFVILPFGAAIVSLVLGLVMVALVGYIAMRKFGGVTGDVYGAAEQAAEMAILAVVLAFA